MQTIGKEIIAAFIFVVLLLTSKFSYGQAKIHIDEVGRQVRVPIDSKRIIALAPNLTEIVYSIGQGGKLVGATKYSNYPKEAKELPRVGTYIQLDLEKIVALRPDLCLANKDGNPKHAIERLVKMGIPVYVANPQNLAGILTTVTSIGKLLNAEAETATVVEKAKQRILAIEQLVATVENPPAVFFQIDADPIVSVGSGTFIDELITRAGGKNIAAGSMPYPRYNWEALLKQQPTIVIITSMSGGQTPEELISAWRKFPQIAAVRQNRLHVVDADLYDRATIRLIKGLEVLTKKGLEVLTKLIHPDLTLSSGNGHGN